MMTNNSNDVIVSTAQAAATISSSVLNVGLRNKVIEPFV